MCVCLRECMCVAVTPRGRLELVAQGIKMSPFVRLACLEQIVWKLATDILPGLAFLVQNVASGISRFCYNKNNHTGTSGWLAGGGFCTIGITRHRTVNRVNEAPTDPSIHTQARASAHPSVGHIATSLRACCTAICGYVFVYVCVPKGWVGL